MIRKSGDRFSEKIMLRQKVNPLSGAAEAFRRAPNDMKRDSIEIPENRRL
jgi:hypothetical protein